MESVSIVSLLEPEFLQGVQWKHSQGVHWRGFRVHLWKAQEGYHYSHSSRSASQAQEPCKVYAVWPRPQTYILRLIYWSTTVAKLHRVKRFKYLGVFEELPEGVRAGIILRELEVIRKIKRNNVFEVVKESSGRIQTFKVFKRRQGNLAIVQRTSYWRRRDWMVGNLRGELPK